MLLSRDRILTTHVGSLPRNDELSDLLIKREEGEAVDPDRLHQAMDRAVLRIVQEQSAAGIDIGNDGEQQRIAFSTFVAQPISKLSRDSTRRPPPHYEESPYPLNVLIHRFPKP